MQGRIVIYIPSLVPGVDNDRAMVGLDYNMLPSLPTADHDININLRCNILVTQTLREAYLLKILVVLYSQRANGFQTALVTYQL